MSQDDLQIKIRAIAEGMQDAINQVKELEKAVTDGGEKSTRAADQHEAAGKKLEAAFGGSSRAVNQFGNAIGAVIPLPGQLSYAIDILIDSGLKAALTFGGMTAAVMAVGAAFDFIKGKMAEAEKQADATRDAIVRAAQDNTPQKQAMANAKIELDAIEEKKRDVARRQAQASEDYSRAIEMRDDPSLRAKRSAAEQSQVDAQAEAARVKLNNIHSQLLTLIERANELSRNPLITPEMIGGLQEFSTEAERSAKAVEGIAINASLAADRIGGLSSSKRAFGSEGYERNAFDSNPANRSEYLQSEAVKYREAWESAVNAAQAKHEAFIASLQGKAESMLSVSQVTSQDLADTAAGKYKDKNDENIRRLRLFPEIDSAIFKKLPQQIQDELKAAFEQGGGAYKLKIDDLIQKGESFQDSRLWDLDKMGADLRAQVEAENNKKRLAEEVVKRSGLDTGNASVMAQANKLTGADPTGVGGVMADVKKQVEDFRPANSLAQAFQADKDNIIKAGRKMGEFIVSGLKDQIVDAVDDISTQFMKSLTGSLDGRYVRQAKTFGGLQ